MIRKDRLYLALGVLLISSLLTACMQEEFEFDKLSDEMEFEVGAFAPVAKGSLSLDDLISEVDSTGVLTADEEGLIYLSYQDSLASFMATDIIDIPDQQFDEVVVESDADVPPYVDWGDSIVVERTKSLTWMYSQNERIDSIELYAGSFRFEVSSSFNHTGYVELYSSSVTKEGEPYREKIQISSESGTFSDIQVFDLSGYTFSLDTETSTGDSELNLEFRVVLYNSGNGISSGDRIDIATDFTNLEFESIYGYVGNYQLAGESGEFEIDFFDNSLEGDIFFEAPEVNFHIGNGYGVPVEVSIDQFEGRKEDAAPTNLVFDAGVNPFSVAYPDKSQEGEIVKDTISLNRSNTSISDFLNYKPEVIAYQVSAASNPENDPEVYNFAHRDSRLDVDVEFVLPLWFSASNFSLQDTIDMDLTDIDNYESIDELGFRLAVENELPAQVQMQVIFLDANYQPLDQLFLSGEEVIIPASEVDANGTVIARTNKATEVALSKTRLEGIENTVYAAIVARLATSDYAPENRVKFYERYKVRFQLSVDADATFNSNDL
ncbi:MAG: hypothetical protein R6U66_11755 [Bacteroidales bacterium]